MSIEFKDESELEIYLKEYLHKHMTMYCNNGRDTRYPNDGVGIEIGLMIDHEVIDVVHLHP